MKQQQLSQQDTYHLTTGRTLGMFVLYQSASSKAQPVFVLYCNDSCQDLGYVV